MNSSTISLLNTIEWSKRFNFRRPIALGHYLEPAISNANIILQTIIGPPFAWRWNRVVTGFITTAGQQDYFLFNWQPNFILSLGSVTVDNNGNCQSVITTGSTGTIVPIWDSGVGNTTNDGSVVWINLGSISTPVSSIYNFNWIETSSIQDTVNNVPKWFEMESKICSGLDSNSSRSRYISAQGDDGFGNITFRFLPVPDKAYPVAITLQQKAPLFTKLSQFWSPIPDEYSRIYNWGFLSLAWLYADDPRFGLANQKFVSQLLSATEGLSETEKNIFLGNWQFVTGQPVANANRLQQADQMRGL
jgi:hypothetical protein